MEREGIPSATEETAPESLRDGSFLSSLERFSEIKLSIYEIYKLCKTTKKWCKVKPDECHNQENVLSNRADIAEDHKTNDIELNKKIYNQI